MPNSKIEKILILIIKLCLYLTLLTPLVFWDQVIYPFVFPKIIFFRVVVEVMLFFFVILCLYDKTYTPKPRPLAIAIGIYLGIAALTSAIGYDPYQSFFSTLARGEGVFTLFHVFAFFLIASSVLKTKKEWSSILFFFFLIFFIENILAFAQVVHLPYVKMFGATRPNGSFGNPAYFAIFEMLGLGIIYLLFKTYDKKKWQLLFIFTMLLGLINVYFAINRAATLGLFIGAMLYGILEIFNRPNIQTRKKYLKILAAIPMVLVLAHFISPRTSIIKKLTYYPLNEPSIRNRLIGWDVGWSGFKERPIFGWGNENYSYIFNSYFSPAIITESGSYSWYDRAHNTFIDILLANGIFGLASIFSLLITAFIIIFKSNREKTEKNILYSVITSYAVANVFIFDTISTLILFFLILSFINSYPYDATGKILHFFQKFAHKQKNFFQTKFAVFAMILTLLSLYYFNIKPLRAVYYASLLPLLQDNQRQDIYKNFKKSFDSSPANNYELREILGAYLIKKIIDGESVKNFEPLFMLSMESMQKSIRAAPNNIRARLTLSELARIFSEINPYYAQIAEKEALAIILLSPKRYQPYLTLGKLRFSQNRNSEGIQYFQKAVDMYPNFIGTHWDLALGYIYESDFENVKKELEIMKKIEPLYIYQEKNIAILSGLLKKQKQYDIAIHIFEDAIQKNYGVNEKNEVIAPYYYRELGELYLLVGKKGLAEEMFSLAKTAEQK